jgi:hypothetical protein
MVAGLALICVSDNDLQNWRWTVESGAKRLAFLFVGLYYKQYTFDRRGTEWIIGYIKRWWRRRSTEQATEDEGQELTRQCDDSIASEPQDSE